MARTYSRTLPERSGTQLLFNWFILVFFFLTATGEKQRSKEQYSERHNDFSAFQEPQDSDLEEVERQITILRQRSPPPRPPSRVDLDVLLRDGTMSRDRSGWLWGWGEMNDRGLDATLHQLILRDGAEHLLKGLQGKARALRCSLRGTASVNRTTSTERDVEAAERRSPGINRGMSGYAQSGGLSARDADPEETMEAKAELKRLEGLIARLKRMLKVAPPPPSPPPPRPPPPSPPPPPRATHIPKPHQRPPTEAVSHTTGSTSSSSELPPAGGSSSPPPGPYYQQGLISRTLRVSARPVASPYLTSDVTYYPVLADTQALESLLKEQGYKDLHLAPYLYLVNQSRSCMEVAQDVQEPFVEDMLQRNRPLPGDLPGGVPLTAWRWDKGIITREEFDAVPTQLNKLGDHPRDCAHCTSVAKFKVLNGVLMRAIDNPGNAVLDAVEGMLVVAVHLYDIPDVDFLVHWGDGTTRDVPVLSFNIDRSQPHAGWQLPYWEHWQDHALSLAQSLVWSECTRTRYPRARAIPRAVWRGSTSDPFISAVNVSNLRHLARYHLHTLTDLYPDVLDARISEVTGTRDEVTCPRPSSSSRLSDTAPCAQQALQAAQVLEVILGINGTQGHVAPAPPVDSAEEYDYAAAYAAKHGTQDAESTSNASTSPGSHVSPHSSQAGSSSTSPAQVAAGGSQVWSLGSQLPSGPWNMSEEDFQHYALLLDMDGSGWSSRFFRLAQYTAAPVLRQASPLQAWYEHLLGTPGGPGAAVQHYARNLSDVVSRTRETLRHLGYNPDAYYQRHGRQVVVPDPVTCPPAPPTSPPPPAHTTTPGTPPLASKAQPQEGDLRFTVDGDEHQHGLRGTTAQERQSISSSKGRTHSQAPHAKEQPHHLALGESGHTVHATSRRAKAGASLEAASHTGDVKPSPSSSHKTKHRKARALDGSTQGSRHDKSGRSTHTQSTHTDSRTTGSTHTRSHRSHTGEHRQWSGDHEGPPKGSQVKQVDAKTNSRHTGTDGSDGTAHSGSSSSGQTTAGLTGTVRRFARMLLMLDEQQATAGEEVAAAVSGAPERLNAGSEDVKHAGVLASSRASSSSRPAHSSTQGGNQANSRAEQHALLRGGVDTTHPYVTEAGDLQQQKHPASSSAHSVARVGSVASAVLKSAEEIGMWQGSSSKGQTDDEVAAAWRGLSSEAAVRNLNAAAAVLLNRWSMVEAVAYVLGKYAAAIDWQPQPDDRYEKVRFHPINAPWLPDKLARQIEDATGGFYFSSREFDRERDHDSWDDDWDGWYHSVGYDIARQAAAREAARTREHAEGGSQQGDTINHSYGRYSGYFERGDY